MCLVRKLFACLSLLLAFSVPAQQSAPVEEGPEVWKARAERAASLRREADGLRGKADARRKKEDFECRKSFFENACRDSARDAWLEQVNSARAMEMEAVGLERSIRAHELALREKNRPPRIPSPSSLQWLGPAPAPAMAETPSAPVAKPQVPRESRSSRASLKAPSPADRAERQANRESAAEAAAARAAKAQADAARYAERRRAHAAKQSSSSTAK
jgi:hypothetical protein